MVCGAMVPRRSGGGCQGSRANRCNASSHTRHLACGRWHTVVDGAPSLKQGVEPANEGTSCARMLPCPRPKHLDPDAPSIRAAGRRSAQWGPHERRDGGSRRRRSRRLPCARACICAGLRYPGGGGDRPRRRGYAPVGASAHRAWRRRLVAADALEVVYTEVTAGVMKRAHRRCHRLVWPILLLCSAAAVGLALVQRSAVPQNTAWPPILAAAST